jgi:hypothetical protein
MARLQNRGIAERELAQALREISRTNDSVNDRSPCPSEGELRKFVAGKYRTKLAVDEMLAHLGSCEQCTALLQHVRERRVLVMRTSLALAAVAAVIIIAVLATLQRSSSIPTSAATIDLRLVSPTRGSETSETAPTAVVRSAGGLRVVLPIGSEGKYDCEIRQESDGRLLLRGSGEALLENHEVTLNLPISLRSLPSGRYSLRLGRNGSDWAKYPLDLK